MILVLSSIDSKDQYPNTNKFFTCRLSQPIKATKVALISADVHGLPSNNLVYIETNIVTTSCLKSNFRPLLYAGFSDSDGKINIKIPEYVFIDETFNNIVQEITFWIKPDTPLKKPDTPLKKPDTALKKPASNPQVQLKSVKDQSVNDQVKKAGQTASVVTILILSLL